MLLRARHVYMMTAVVAAVCPHRLVGDAFPACVGMAVGDGPPCGQLSRRRRDGACARSTREEARLLEHAQKACGAPTCRLRAFSYHWKYSAVGCGLN